MKLNPFMKTNIVGAVAVALFFTAFYMGLWYIFQPMLTYLAIIVDDMLVSQGLDSSNSDNLILLVKLVVDIFLFLPIVGLWIWVFNKAQEKDYVGYPQYG